jgi:hypothetical protein
VTRSDIGFCKSRRKLLNIEEKLKIRRNQRNNIKGMLLFSTNLNFSSVYIFERNLIVWLEN